ncbi:MAG: restriction endonuclease subunit R [Rhodothermaceae bacterium]|nr:restriction endonuclease subunit R [Rhodothermaceae bacterium]MYG69924.1 restriction endonuclease subunit R [Rhodothermaceae bacterium]
MILKDYQKRTLATVADFLRCLTETREKDRQARKQDSEWGFDWVRRAWKKVVPLRKYSETRRNGLGELLPVYCLKIPTGGGKTLLATRVIDLVNIHFRQNRRGLVLWIVPTSQIYIQTLKALRDLDHPYRQQLDLSSGQRTLILEKTSSFGPRDVAENLCILLLMLPSANRGLTKKDQLRIYRDSGAYDQFFPSDDESSAHAELLEKHTNLDVFKQLGSLGDQFVKTSLGNTIRLQKPLIILDEGHKAYSTNAKKTLEDFNPCMIVELSATPTKLANVLVEIRGVELNAEEMIKLDLNIRNKENGDWRGTLLESIQHREMLESEARRYEAESGIYIRPICVIQVERTGKAQRTSGYIHTDDVREFLLRNPRIKPEYIAVKTSERDELKGVEDGEGLLSRNCPIRFIITKQALQEGWDCSFAYILTILANPMSRTGLTQLVGRILRQPYANKTGVSWLDESYVFCFSRRGNEILKEIRKGFGLEGLQGLAGRVTLDHNGVSTRKKQKTRPRARYEAAVRNLVLPAFMIQDENRWRLVHYEADILSRLPWEEIDVSLLAELEFEEQEDTDVLFRMNLTDEHQVVKLQNSEDASNTDYGTAASHLLDLVPNPWHGYNLVQRTFETLFEHHPAEQVTANYVFILGELRQLVEKERDRLSHGVFHSLLESETIRFLVVTEDLGLNRLPEEIDRPSGNPANREDGFPYQMSLFDVIPEDDLNQLETKVATYLDQQARLFFWYRNRPRKDYFVQGWKPNRIYADFIVTLQGSEPEKQDTFHEVYVVETKGIHLAGSEDTEYKRSVFDICNQHARKVDWATFVPGMRGRVVHFKVVDEENWKARLNSMLSSQRHHFTVTSE